MLECTMSGAPSRPSKSGSGVFQKALQEVKRRKVGPWRMPSGRRQALGRGSQ